ncbi:MAG: hypothetical protein J3K34DRAFT_517956 [Monoraphidium minutum]|nr:MAG: hypothetical protein J3K34DRAFT_517956 [Monoraphidium minutum]
MHPGKDWSFTLIVWNRLGATAPATTAALWADQPDFQPCYAEGDAMIKIPPLPPLGSKTFKAKLRMPPTKGVKTVRISVDSGCVAAGSPVQAAMFLNVTQDAAAPDLRVVSRRDDGMFDLGAHIQPRMPFGSTTVEKGWKLVAWADGNAPPLPPRACAGAVGDAAAPLPKMPPGRELEVQLSLTAGAAKMPPTYALELCLDGPGAAPLQLESSVLLYLASPAPLALMMAPAPSASSRGSDVTFKPASVAGGGTFSARFRVRNLGGVDGVVGAAGLWLAPFDWQAGLSMTDFTPGTRCNHTGAVVTADFSKVKVKTGKTKVVSFKGVPAPAAPGPWVVAAQMDLGCVNPLGCDSPNMKVAASVGVLVVT